MQKNQEGILEFIIRIDKNIKIEKSFFTRFQDLNDTHKIDLAKHRAGDIEDYASLKDSIENIDLDVNSRKLAFQYVEIKRK